VTAFRGGVVEGGAPFTKDACYCKGIVLNYAFIRSAIQHNRADLIPYLFVGKVANISKLLSGNDPINIQYTPIDPGSCLPQLLAGLTNPLAGVLQDIAFNPANGNIYTYFRAPGATATPGLLAWFNPANNPTFTCMMPAQANIPTNDLSGLYFGADSALFILTTDGRSIKQELTAHGADFNGSTSYDRTNYFETVKASDDNRLTSPRSIAA